MPNPSPQSRPRRIRSFVRRDSRITRAQADALDKYLSRYRFAQNDLDFNAYNTLNLEIGVGDGECTLALARSNPNHGYVAAEVYRVGLGRVLHAVNAEALHNIRVIDIDVVDALSELPADYFDRMMVFFPDPWPKKRHHKRRLVQLPFLNLAARVLKRSGCLFMATDIEDYAIHMLEHIDQSKIWQNLAGPGNWAIRPSFRPLTKFEAKGLAAGRNIFDICAARRV